MRQCSIGSVSRTALGNRPLRAQILTLISAQPSRSATCLVLNISFFAIPARLTDARKYHQARCLIDF